VSVGVHNRGSNRGPVVAALVLVAVLASASAAVAHPPKKPPFKNVVDAPPAPAKVTFGASLLGTPEPRTGNFESDAEFWEAVFAAAGGISGVQRTTTVPVAGWLVGVTIHGHAVSGDMPGPEGSEPFRIGVEEALPGGTLKVLETSTPPFTLPGTEGLRYFWIGPPYTTFPMRLKPGEVVSFDTRGGTWAIFSHAPGSVVDHFAGTGLTQNAGVEWTGTPHEDDELEMQVVEQPTVQTAPVDHAVEWVKDAILPEEQALHTSHKHALELLREALNDLGEAAEDVEEAEESKAGVISRDTAASLNHYLDKALAEDRAAESAKKSPAIHVHINAALAAKRTLLSDLRTAKRLALKVP
jgi:hypothetical protein